MSTLVTGGTGYIGAHIVRALTKRGAEVVIADDVATGDARRVGAVPLVRLDIASDGADRMLAEVMRRHGVTAVIHLAARKRVDESVQRPVWYYRQNLGSLENVLVAMQASAVSDIVFSSSAAVYGSVRGQAVSEEAPTRPINPYGETKLAGEWLVRAAAAAQPLRAVSLRYFNVAGAARDDLGDRHASNLIPMVFERIDAGRSPLVYGDDYDTADGTCVRDYVHVEDIATAHVRALETMGSFPTGAARVYNVGTGRGTSVREVIERIAVAAGMRLEVDVRPRRPGDPARVVASADRIAVELGWTAALGVDEIITSALSSRRHFQGLLAAEPAASADR